MGMAEGAQGAWRGFKIENKEEYTEELTRHTGVQMRLEMMNL